MIRLDEVERAIADVAAGRPVVVVDDSGRNDYGDIVFAAESMTTSLMAFAVRYSSGVICVPMTGDRLDRLAIPLMVADNDDPMRTAFTVSVDATTGVTTGISAADRARTARVLADPDSVVDDVRRPGHVFALRSRSGGVLTRRGHTEATVDLVELAGCNPVGVLAELANDDGTMMNGDDLREFADQHDLAMISIESLVRYRSRHEMLVTRSAETRLPTRHGVFTAIWYLDGVDGAEHLAVIRGDVDAREAVPVWVHTECTIGDLFGSYACLCSASLNAALEMLGDTETGVLVYIRNDTGRSRHPRSAEAAARILRDLGVISVVPRDDDPGVVSAFEGHHGRELARPR